MFKKLLIFYISILILLFLFFFSGLDLTETDKQLHLSISFALSTSLMYLTKKPIFSLAIVLFIGIMREVLCPGVDSMFDMSANTMGLILSYLFYWI